MPIGNPAEWAVDALKEAGHALSVTSRALLGTEAPAALPTVHRITTADLKDALAKGYADFAASRTHVIFLAIIYPVAGIVLARFAFDYNMLPLMFPLVAGFALLGPVAAVGLYELSRRREQGLKVSWLDAFGVIGRPTFGAIFVLGLIMLGIFLLWLGAAQLIYWTTMGLEPPTSIVGFISDVLTTGAGWALIVVGMGVGFLFAVAVLAISVVSFPMLLDHEVGLRVAVGTSIRAVAENPRAMATWGLIVAGGLVLGSIPLFLGLIVVMPVLGHATWHLYRKVVAH